MKRSLVLCSVAGVAMCGSAQAWFLQPEKPATPPPSTQPTKPTGPTGSQPTKPEIKPDPKAPEVKSQPDDMDAWLKMNQPGPEHRALDFMVGEWDATVKFMAMPGAAPEISKGSEKNEWVLDGRFIQTHYSGTMAGHPFNGISYLGYNKTTKKYESTWMDSTGTGIMMMVGDMDSRTHTMTMTGVMDDAMTGSKKQYKSVTKMESNDKMVFSMMSPGPDGKDFTELEIIYTRKTGAPRIETKPEVKPDAKAPAKPGK